MLKNLFDILCFASDFRRVARAIYRYAKIGSLEDRIAYDGFDKPAYAYLTYQAALQAKKLGFDAVSVIEFGVAGGKGLLQLEENCIAIRKKLGINIEIFGFDLEVGLPEALDYRDLPYAWEKGYFKSDFKILKSRLKKAKLIVGDVKETVETFFAKYDPPPIGFISFDLDYYSSTKNALKIFDKNSERFLPRAFCYFDDIIGSETEYHCEYVGELLAISEFNAERENMKLGKINGMKYKRKVPNQWNEQTYVCHIFEHSKYNENINKDFDWSFTKIKKY